MGRVETVVFLSLVLDLFAFTIPLPLFPRIIEWYTKREASDPHGFLSQTLGIVSAIRGVFLKTDKNSERWDVVLLGGLLGSLFSGLQFFVSPRIGALSDKYGRKNVLLVTMIGNMLSAIVWVQSTTFASYMLSRVIGGLSEGNVQLAIAILSDVTTPATRSKTLAYVGIAFAICFCIGPPIGAYFASRPIPPSLTAGGQELNLYALPALLSLVLLAIETIFLAFALPETRGTRVQATDSNKLKDNGTNGHTATIPVERATPEQRLRHLQLLRTAHFLFLGIFSGIEFSLTFLTFDLFDWTNRQNGSLLGSMGVMSALLQGGYVRRAVTKVGEGNMARRGVSACAIALVLLAAIPVLVARDSTQAAIRCLQLAAVCMAFTSATVVNSLTAAASLQCDEPMVDSTGKAVDAHPKLAKGKALGEFRSAGQLGRALGPLIACGSYWTLGPAVTYSAGAILMFALSGHMRQLRTPKTKTA